MWKNYDLGQEIRETLRKIRDSHIFKKVRHFSKKFLGQLLYTNYGAIGREEKKGTPKQHNNVVL